MEDTMEEYKKSLRVCSFNKNTKPRFFGEDDQLYCALDNHKCDSACRKGNTESQGTLICSEVISSKFLPKKKGRKKKFFSRREERNDESFV